MNFQRKHREAINKLKYEENEIDCPCPCFHRKNSSGGMPYHDNKRPIEYKRIKKNGESTSGKNSTFGEKGSLNLTLDLPSITLPNLRKATPTHVTDRKKVKSPTIVTLSQNGDKGAKLDIHNEIAINKKVEERRDKAKSKNIYENFKPAVKAPTIVDHMKVPTPVEDAKKDVTHTRSGGTKEIFVIRKADSSAELSRSKSKCTQIEIRIHGKNAPAPSKPSRTSSVYSSLIASSSSSWSSELYSSEVSSYSSESLTRTSSSKSLTAEPSKGKVSLNWKEYGSERLTPSSLSRFINKQKKDYKRDNEIMERLKTREAEKRSGKNVWRMLTEKKSLLSDVTTTTTTSDADTSESLVIKDELDNAKLEQVPQKLSNDKSRRNIIPKRIKVNRQNNKLPYYAAGTESRATTRLAPSDSSPWSVSKIAEKLNEVIRQKRKNGDEIKSQKSSTSSLSINSNLSEISDNESFELLSPEELTHSKVWSRRRKRMEKERKN